MIRVQGKKTGKTGRGASRGGVSRRPASLAWLGGAAAAAGLFAAAPVRAADDGATQQQLLDEVRALRAKVEQLEQGQVAQQAQQDRTDAALVDATVDRIRQDAEGRSQLLAPEGFTAGYDNGKFLIQSADGNFVLNPSVQFQFRYVGDFRDGSKNGGTASDDWQTGFEVRRLKFILDGNLFGKDLTYHFQWATSRTNGTLVLEEAFARYAFAGTPFAIRGGTYAEPLSHETVVSSKRQLAVERSFLNNVIISGGVGGENYIQGVSGIYDDGGALRAEVIFHDGINSRNTNFVDSSGSTLLGINNPQWAVTGRVDYKLSGDWKQYDDFTAATNKAGSGDLLVVGGGVDVQQANNVTAFFHTADVQWEPTSVVKGLSVYGAYVGLYRDFNTVGAGIDDKPYDWGVLVQAGYMLNDQWEVFARYDFTHLDDGAPTGSGTLGAAARVSDSIHEVTVGVNYYLKGHAAKFTTDFVWLPNGSPVNDDGSGVLAQPTDENQFLLRAQFQLLL